MEVLSCGQTKFSKVPHGTINLNLTNSERILISLTHVETFTEFGEIEVSVLTKYYEPVLECASVKVDEVETEWNMLKAELYDR